MTDRIAFCIRADGEWIPILDYIDSLKRIIKEIREDRDIALEQLNKEYEAKK